MKIAVLKSSENSFWPSIAAAIDGFEQSYRNLAGQSGNNFRFFSYEMCEDEAVDLPSLVSQVELWNPDKIVLLDHRPNPLQILAAFKGGEQSSRFQFYVHIFGDFAVYPQAFHQFGPAINDLKICWLAPSQALQKSLLFFLEDNVSTQICPYPVDAQKFYFTEILRHTYRQNLGLSPQDFLLTYVGRLTLQKNIHLLLESFAIAAEEFPHLKLLLVGDFDDKGAPFHGIEPRRGYYYQYLHRQIIAFEKKFPNRLFLKNTQAAKNVHGLLNASDSFISLSTYHDEEFGMAPLESLMCGTPCILTDWGGYKEFLGGPNSFSVPVVFSAGQLQMDLQSVVQQIRLAQTQTITAHNRLYFSDIAARRFSFPAVQEKISQILSQEPEVSVFHGRRTKAYLEMSFAQKNFLDSSIGETLYRDFYRNYPSEFLS